MPVPSSDNDYYSGRAKISARIMTSYVGNRTIC